MRRHRQALVLAVVGAVALGAGALAAAAAPPASSPAATKAYGQAAAAAVAQGAAHAATAADTEAPVGADAPSDPAKPAAASHGQGAAKKAAKAAAGSASTAGAAASGSHSACAASAAFSQFGDDGRYALLANGTLETGVPARRAGARVIVPENESFHLHAAGDTRSLQLRSGDSVAFHATCLPRLNPVFRLVARAVTGTGSLKLQVQYGPAKRLHAVQLATLAPSGYSAWTATPALPFLDGAKRLVDQVHGNVWLVLSVTGPATWEVDDLYIDPYVNK